MPEENIRTYQFNVPGFIPGVPGDWPAGSWVQVDEDTKQILDWGPRPVVPPAQEEQPENPLLSQNRFSNLARSSIDNL